MSFFKLGSPRHCEEEEEGGGSWKMEDPWKGKVRMLENSDEFKEACVFRDDGRLTARGLYRRHRTSLDHHWDHHLEVKFTTQRVNITYVGM